MNGIIHVHSEHSIFDSCAKVKDIVNRARELKADFITLTDHGTMSGIDDFIEECKGNEEKNIPSIKGIPGVEAYVNYDINGMSIKSSHLILLAKNIDGYHDISNAVTDSNSNIIGEKPIMTFDILKRNFQNKGNVIATSACMNGVINAIIRYNSKILNEIDKIDDKMKELPSTKDPDYLELVNNINNLEARIETLTNMKADLKKIAGRSYVKREKVLAKLEGDEYLAEKQKLDRDKQESNAAKIHVEEIEQEIKKLKTERTKENDIIKSKDKLLNKRKILEENKTALRNGMISEKDIMEAAKEVLTMFIDIFGKDNFFIELQSHDINSETSCMLISIDLAREMKIPLVAANDAHMLSNSKESIRGRQILNSLRFNNFKNLNIGDEHLYLKTDEELKEILFKNYPDDAVEEAMHNISKVGRMCNVIFPKEEHYPKFKSDIMGETAEAALKRMSYEGISWRFPRKEDWNSSYQQRLDHELDVICEMGYADYHLIVQDFLRVGRMIGKLPDAKLEYLKEHIYKMSLSELLVFLKDNAVDVGMAIGPGRGSAAGSLVCYLLGITSIDPIKYDLLFERFLNIERQSMPDIDSDFNIEIRELVLEYVKKRYGEKAVCCILTDSTQAAKKAIRNCARIYGSELYNNNQYFYNLGDEICKSIPKKINKFSDMVDDNATCYEFLKNKFKNNQKAIKILEDAKIVEGSLVGHGAHAAGVVISDNEKVSDYVPLLWNSSLNQWVCQCNMTHVEEKGLLKMDFLGLKNLNIISEALRLVKSRHGIELNFDDFNFDNIIFKEIFSMGDTNGVFQVESGGMKQMLKQFQPSSFEDIILLISAYRPGPMSFIPSIIEGKHGIKKPSYIIPQMAEVLDVTYGFPIYQEQLMEIFHRFAGFTLGEADTVRKYMSKKKVDKFLTFKPKFINGLVENGAKEKDAETFWEQLVDFAKYAFNKSHAAAYAYVAYITAYLKYYYPREYITALLSYTPLEKIDGAISDCFNYGIKVNIPNINTSKKNFSLSGDDIYFGLGRVKGVASAAEPIIKEREHGDFISFKDFLKRCPFVDKGTIESLIMSGAFDCFTENRKALLNVYELLKKCMGDITASKQKINEGLEILELIKNGKNVTKTYKYFKSFKNVKNIETKIQEERKNLQELENKFIEIDIPIQLEENLKEKLSNEKSVLNVFLSANPIDDFIIPENVTPINNLYQTKYVTVAGVITNLRKVNRKSDGAEFAFFTLEDKSGKIDINCFVQTYNQFKNLVEEGNVVMISGNVFEDEIESIRLMESDESENSSDINVVLKMTSKNISTLKPVRKNLFLFVQNKIEWETDVKPVVKEYINDNGHPLHIIDKLENKIQKTSYTVDINIMDDKRLSFS